MQMSLRHILRVDTVTGDVHCMTAATDIGTYNVLDVWNGLIVVCYTNPAQPTKIVSLTSILYGCMDKCMDYINGQINKTNGQTN